MKSNLELEEDETVDGLLALTGENMQVVLAEHLRLLEWNELVRQGDFVADSPQGFKLWAGPGGFRADAFVMPIYRRISPLVRETKSGRRPRSRRSRESRKI